MTNATYTIAQLTPAHAADWQAMRLASIRDFPLGFLTTQAEAARISLDDLAIRFKRGNDWGVFHNDTLVGFCSCRKLSFERTQHRAEIGPFFITAQHQGTPAATLLMETIISAARADDVEQLELYVDSTNHRPIRFYERMGFKKVATLPNAVKIDGVAHDDLFYIRRLDG